MSDPTASPVIEELIGSLCGQVERAEDKAQRWAQELMAERKRANEAERALAAAIEALEPFAKQAEGISDWWGGERRLNSLSVEPVKVMHVRRAFAIVTASKARASIKPKGEQDG